MAQDAIRSFLAVELSEETRREAFSFVEKIQKNYPSFRFIPYLNWHLTLHFLGQVSPEKINKLRSQLPPVFMRTQSFNISLERLGAFPDTQRPRILWIGAVGDLSKLLELKKSLDQVLQKMNFQIESREYHPHITIARLRKEGKTSFQELSLQFKGETISRIDHVTLFKSVLAPEGARYEPLAKFPFGRID